MGQRGSCLTLPAAQGNAAPTGRGSCAEHPALAARRGAVSRRALVRAGTVLLGTPRAARRLRTANTHGSPQQSSMRTPRTVPPARQCGTPPVRDGPERGRGKRRGVVHPARRRRAPCGWYALAMTLVVLVVMGQRGGRRRERRRRPLSGRWHERRIGDHLQDVGRRHGIVLADVVESIATGDQVRAVGARGSCIWKDCETLPSSQASVVWQSSEAGAPAEIP
jgi:hypothetical protein